MLFSILSPAYHQAFTRSDIIMIYISHDQDNDSDKQNDLGKDIPDMSRIDPN